MGKLLYRLNADVVTAAVRYLALGIKPNLITDWEAYEKTIL